MGYFNELIERRKSEPQEDLISGLIAAEDRGDFLRHGELLARVTRTASIANRSKAALSRPPFWVCSASRARQELAFAPAHSLPDAVRATYYWYLKSGWLGGSRRADSVVA